MMVMDTGMEPCCRGPEGCGRGGEGSLWLWASPGMGVAWGVQRVGLLGGGTLGLEGALPHLQVLKGVRAVLSRAPGQEMGQPAEP